MRLIHTADNGRFAALSSQARLAKAGCDHSDSLGGKKNCTFEACLFAPQPRQYTGRCVQAMKCRILRLNNEMTDYKIKNI